MKINLLCPALFLCVCINTILHAQTISTVAGSGVAGYTGDGGPATAAELNRPYGVFVDVAGNIYIGDPVQQIVRKVSAAGIISTFAGGGVGLGDGGPATDASIYDPIAITADHSGNIYIADASDNRVRVVSTAGIITTFAGNGISGFGGDGGAATAASISVPYGLAIDVSGNIFIADYGNARIRKVTPSGVISTFAGTGTHGFSGDGGPAAAAELMAPFGIAADASGNLYIADVENNDVRKVNATGIITTIAGTGTGGSGGDGGPATAAELDEPYGVATDVTGNIYILDQANEKIRKINTSGIIHSYAGTGMSGYSGDGGLAVLAQVNMPYGIATDGAGNLYIADNYNHRIRYITDTLHIGAISGADSVCLGDFVTLGDTTSGGVWSSGNTAIAIVGSGTGIITGIAPGTAIISYTKFGISAIGAIIVIHLSPSPVTGDSIVCPDASISLYNAVAGGLWSCVNAIVTVGGTGVITAGPTAGMDTVLYIVPGFCGADTATYHVRVLPPDLCVAAVGAIPAPTSGLKVFPSPGDGNFTLLVSSVMDGQATVTIADISGRLLKELSIKTNTATEVILREVPGLYLVSATTGSARYEGKITLVR